MSLYYKYKKQLKLKGEVGMSAKKYTRFVGIMCHIHYTSLRLLFSFIMIKYYTHIDSSTVTFNVGTYNIDVHQSVSAGINTF